MELLKGSVWKWLVEKGDSYSSISQRTGVSVRNLMRWNKYSSNEIPVGVVLNISDPNAPQSLSLPTVELGENGKIEVRYYAEAANDNSAGSTFIIGLMNAELPDNLHFLQTVVIEYSGRDSLLVDSYDHPVFFENGNPREPYQREVDDTPQNPTKRWHANTSLVKATSSGYERLVTFSWGYYLGEDGVTRTIPLTITDEISPFHLETIRSLPQLLETRKK